MTHCPPDCENRAKENIALNKKHNISKRCLLTCV